MSFVRMCSFAKRAALIYFQKQTLALERSLCPDVMYIEKFSEQRLGVGRGVLRKTGPSAVLLRRNEQHENL